MAEFNLNKQDLLSGENIAELLDDEQLEYIGSSVVDGFKTDLDSRKEWESKVEEWLLLALQVAEEKTFPWPNAANVKYPLLTTAALQFSARAYPALISGTNAVRGRVVGFDEDGSKQERAIRVAKHMSYQILEEIPDWEEQMDRLLFALPIIGCMFKKSYFSSIKQTNISEVVYPKELVVNYWATSLEDAERITHVLRFSENDMYERVKSGVFRDVDIEESNPNDASANKQPRTSDSATGLVVPENDEETSPYTLLEQHCFFDLDGDGYKEPYIVTVDFASKTVLKIAPRYNEMGINYNVDGDIVSIDPDHYFTKFSFVPSPDGGFYDIGFGILLGPLNNTINTLVNQLLDAGTLSNMQAGFIAKGIRIKGGNKPFTPGEWKVASSTGDDLRKGIVPMPVRDPSSVLFNLLDLMINSAERLSSVTDMMTGDIPGQNTKATVAMAAIEQGMKVFSSIYKRVHRSLTKEYKKLFKLNSRYLPENTYFTVLDVGQEKAAKIGKNDYNEGDVDIVVASDPNVATEQQRLAKVQALMDVLQLGTVNVQEVTKRYLEATEQPNIEALMQMPEPQPSLEQLEFEHQKMMDIERLKLDKQLADTKGMLEIAKAEQAEMGQQLDLYKMELEKLKTARDISKEEMMNGSENNEGRVR